MGWPSLPPLILTLALATCSAPADAAAHRWSCADVPSWVLGYSASTVSSTAANMGMTQWQIARLLKCLPKPRSYYG
jgi:ABC-type transport system involved in cytochrome c biogenesis permease subunit